MSMAVTSYLPSLRPPEKAIEDELYYCVMAHYRRMYAYWNGPARDFEEITKRFIDLQNGRFLQEQEQARLQRARVRALKAFKVKDTPRIPPFKGECFKRAWTAFNLWRSKRQARKAIDWLHSHPL